MAGVEFAMRNAAIGVEVGAAPPQVQPLPRHRKRHSGAEVPERGRAVRFPKAYYSAPRIRAQLHSLGLRNTSPRRVFHVVGIHFCCFDRAGQMCGGSQPSVGECPLSDAARFYCVLSP